jgi:tetratricopeptide (TPR) repeat protein
MRKAILSCLLIFASAALSPAGTLADAHSTAAKPLEAPEPFDSPRLGHITLTATTHDAEALRLFRQGVALCYAFNHDEAVKSFHRALDHDPKFAMAHWGIALASGPNVNLPMDKDHEAIALKEIRAAAAADVGLTPFERELIVAQSLRYGEPLGEARGARDSAYATAMRGIAARHPDDADVLGLTAEAILDLSPWHWFTNDGQPVGAINDAIAMLEHGLKVDSTNTLVNHLYIHAVEESPTPERGLVCAARLARLAPDAGHLVHMPSHLWARVGRYHEAAILNTKAARIDSAYVARYQVDGVYPLMYMSHNQDFAGIAFYMEGNRAGALRWARPLAARAEEAAAAMPMIDPFAARALTALVGFHRWDEVLAVPQPSAAVPGTRLYWRFSRGMALAAKGKTAEAQTELDSLIAGAAALPKDFMTGLNTGSDFFSLAHSMLAGRLARARADYTAAERELRDAVTRYDAMAYDEPEDWVLSPQLELGALLLEKRDFAGAEAAFRAELKHHPRHGRALFGLALALDAQGRRADAAKARAEFAVAWRHADTRLSASDL